MHIKRALLLSSLRVAEAWEYKAAGAWFLISQKAYRFVVQDNRHKDEGLELAIFAVSRHETVDVVASYPHRSVSFPDLGELHTFLHRFEIATEIWSPVEGDEK